MTSAPLAPLAAECPTLASVLAMEQFAAIRKGRMLVDPINLRLLPGSVLGVVGPNGVGKSSLLAALAQSGVATTGTVRYGDRDLIAADARTRASIVSLLAQDLGASDEILVREIVGVGAWAARRSDAARATDEALNQMGIPHLADRRNGTLSGGQRQLVQLSRVIAQNTPIVLLDEPTSALDLCHQRLVEQTMRRLANDGKIVIVALHDLSLALNACTQVLLLSDTVGAHAGAPAEVLSADLVHAAYGVRTSIHTTPHGRRFLSTD